ncbi:TIGR03619 family F420-dependent LLM class oxidoreductase [Nitrospinota bacterium]
MKFGISTPHFGRPVNLAELLEIVRQTEALGFDSIWATDHIIMPRSANVIYRENMLDPFSLLGFLAAATERVSIGTSVIIIPYRHPVVVAKMIATADQLSKGRIIFGAGVGWNDGEFGALGRPYDERGRMTDEHLHLIRALWTNETLSFEGEYTRFHDMAISPQPYQRPHPPLWIGGNGRIARRRAARLAEGWHPVGLMPEEVAEGTHDLKALWRENDREGDPVVSIRGMVSMEGVSDVAYRFPARRATTLAGSSGQIVDIIGRYGQAGVEHIVLDMTNHSHASLLAVMEAFAGDVRPKVG